jgi:hypothetical protein
MCLRRLEVFTAVWLVFWVQRREDSSIEVLTIEAVCFSETLASTIIIIKEK